MKTDQAGRLEKSKRLFKIKGFGNSRYRHTVVSDTTLERRLPEMNVSEIRQINYSGLLEDREVLQGVFYGREAVA